VNLALGISSGDGTDNLSDIEHAIMVDMSGSRTHTLVGTSGPNRLMRVAARLNKPEM
jgi:hypothetical protein